MIRLKQWLQNSLNTYIGNLNQFDQTRLNSAVAWLTRTKFGLWILNIAIAVILVVVAGLRKLQSIRSHSLAKSAVTQPLDEPMALSAVQPQPRVLLLVESSIPQCFHYRVKQKIEQLNILDCHVEWLSWSEIDDCKQRIHFVDIVIFYRAPGFLKVMDLIHHAKSLGKLVCYDLDDLIFDRNKLAEKFSQTSAQLSDKDVQDILKGADLYKEAIQACSYGIASTPELQQKMAHLVEKKQCYLLPNGLDDDILRVADLPVPKKMTERVTLFYGSGTKTHDDDFALIGDALSKLIQLYPQVHVVIAGHLTLPAKLQNSTGRIQRLPLMDFSSYLYSLRQTDIAIAPLKTSLFADCKSEIKWLEAAAMGVPSVVSDTARYRDVIEHGENGLIATNSEAWFLELEKLVLDFQLRRNIAENAMKTVLKNYHPMAMAESLHVLLSEMQRQAVTDKLLVKNNHKKSILMVNVLYPPLAIGGATTVVENLIHVLKCDYADEYKLSVLTSEVADKGAYQIREYAKDGVNVTVIGVPYSADLEIRHADDKIHELCVEWLQQNHPDLIHFHSMQRLTASVLQAATHLNIPYVVTVHDAWWLSEHQFLLDANNELIDDRQLNPLISSQSSTKPANAMKRAQYLATNLQQAERIFAVSDYQAEVYQNNGFKQVSVNRNGVFAPAALYESSSKEHREGKLRVAYLGGQSAHKGYNFLRAIIEKNQFSNMQWVVVNLFKPRDYQETEKWGGSNIQMVGKYQSIDMPEFYESIDVLVAPSIWPESFGLVSREASLQRVWVVVADAGGLAEDVIEGETGFIFPMRDAHKCTELLQKMNDNFEHYRDNKPKIDRIKKQIVTIEEQAKELVEHYRLLTAERLA